MKKILYIIAAFIGLFAACKKGTLVENTAYEKISPGDPKYAYIKILNLTPGSPALNFYMDGTKFSAGYSTLGIENAGYAYNGLFPDLGYAITAPTTHTFTGRIIPSLPDPNLEVLNAQITPAAGKYYTIFTTGQYTSTKKIPAPLVIEDVSPALDTSKIFIRLINLYNGGPNVDMVRDVATGAKVVSNVAYGTVSNWMELPNPGSGPTPSNKFLFNNAATGVPIVATAATISFSKGRAYTIYLRGVMGNTTYPFAATSYTTFY
ncbi:DUF4397 domain-containing protein [Pedobacter nutrimenti]|jgi:hypothetical protein|uniref:Uncharacterized protein DUF4397 n=1 Tax=Pedobacter nutrimenti TaxID=1241337 RepID=A0A318UKC0_9SPHI|nr:DUF4397 domain-containing protein [Pedobacter nutrimenti]PYF75608.1 uncharacterized protein DUF4397 [Pedobacter nutrimenti]